VVASAASIRFFISLSTVVRVECLDSDIIPVTLAGIWPYDIPTPARWGDRESGNLPNSVSGDSNRSRICRGESLKTATLAEASDLGRELCGKFLGHAFDTICCGCRGHGS
jgi:hypothetical protein